MAKQNSDKREAREERVLWLVGELRRLCAEDNFAGALPAVEGYPRLTRHKMSEFERDMRDWGLVYGLAFGLAVAKWPGEPHEDTARVAFDAALMVHIRWGGEIQDPTLRREAALRAVVEQYDHWDEDRYRQRSGSPEAPMGSDMSSALHELREAVA
jgi:hypothetical protein